MPDIYAKTAHDTIDNPGDGVFTPGPLHTLRKKASLARAADQDAQLSGALVKGLQEALDLNDFDAPGYHSLERVLRKAYDQSARGKGKDRHANGKPFDRQPIMEIGRMVGPGYQMGQAMKKIQEAFGMFGRSQFDAAQAELLGAIVYASAAWLDIEERSTDQASPETTE